MKNIIQLIFYTTISSVIFAIVERKKSKSFFKNFIQTFLIFALIFIVCDFLTKFSNINVPSDRSGSSMLAIIILLTTITLVKILKK
ncbi:hypothetical protein COJ85_31455 [Bacillus sp. AFS076308]|uniref:hypothetical protein n=1 Tax=unclassified Bacillus (in: firmicutes) TaxID=185979 RepID=UPI000BF6883E|nr:MULTISPECIES: hypothetical protein [unclassified Bacillus (in: firmicutes)]PFN78555.1 hypothetical protein COJ85_31455 [Bacillus sp. AFS076308]PGV48049.1 hypothetical protein COD92_27720 [Bacillus sp. AFS037270]